MANKIDTFPIKHFLKKLIIKKLNSKFKKYFHKFFVFNYPTKIKI